MTTSGWPSIADLHTILFDFDGVFTDNRVYVDQNGVETVSCSRADGLGIDLLRAYKALYQLPFELLIVSRERNPVVAARAAKLGLNVLNSILDKRSAVEAYLAERGGLGWNGVLFAGNDLNDLALVGRVGFFVAPADAHPAVKARAAVVLPELGGAGFVRAIAERLIKIDELSDDEIADLMIRP